MTHPRCHDGPRDDHKRSKSGWWLNSLWPLLSPNRLEHSSHSSTYEITHPYENWQPQTLKPLLSPEMAHTMFMGVLPSWINLLSLDYGLLWKSFLWEAKNPHLAAIPGTQMRPKMWPSSHARFFFLQQFLNISLTVYNTLNSYSMGLG